MKTPIGIFTPKSFYERVVREIDAVADLVREHPELNHHAAERLAKIAQEIRKDAGLPDKP